MAVLLRAALTPSLETKIVTVRALFSCGVFMLSAPGHGSAVLSTYLATHNSQLNVQCGFRSVPALMQAVIAILLMTLIVVLFGWTQSAPSSLVSS